MRKLLFCLSCLFLCFASSMSFAHQLSTAYLSGSFNDTGLFQGQWQVRLYDLEQAIGIDEDGDGELRWRELQNRAEIVTKYLQYHLTFSRANQECTFALEPDWKIDEHFNEAYLLLPVRAQCAIAGTVKINYSAFFEIDSQHKLLLSLLNEKNSVPYILSDSTPSLEINEQSGSRFKTFTEFVKQGAVHIWIGLDHILFLISLLLTCALTRRDRHWIANPKIRDIVWRTTWIVTAFTLAHSVTLTATALNFINLPSRWVEVGIAITVALAALNNIFPLVLRLGWLTFSFGLLHGMGFAGALGELGLPNDQKILTVLAFNLGVEIGQMAIVAIVLPVLIYVRKYYWYTRYTMAALSGIIVLIALQWIVQRI